MKTTSQVPLIKRLAREGKVEQMDIAIFHFHRLTLGYERQKASFKNKEFLRYFEYKN